MMQPGPKCCRADGHMMRLPFTGTSWFFSINESAEKPTLWENDGEDNYPVSQSCCCCTKKNRSSLFCSLFQVYSHIMVLAHGISGSCKTLKLRDSSSLVWESNLQTGATTANPLRFNLLSCLIISSIFPRFLVSTPFRSLQIGLHRLK